MAGILIVDDLAFFRHHLRQILEREGYQVVGEAADGDEALTKYKELRPDAVILDLLMPGTDGFAFLAEVRRDDPHARVIVCSASSHKESVVRALHLGARDFVAKPVVEERLYEALATILGRGPDARTGEGKPR